MPNYINGYLLRYYDRKTMSNLLKISCIQMNSGADMAANITQFEEFTAQAAEQGATFVATPENTFVMDSLGGGATQNRKKYTQDKHPGVKAASEAAKKHGIWVLLGGVAVLPSDELNRDKTYNRAILFGPDGKMTAKYNKVHLFDVNVGDGQAYQESARYLAGDLPVTAKMDEATLGLTICYDLRFPYLYRQLSMQGADILTVPAAFIEYTGKAHWHVLLRARAIENGCFVVAPAQTGEHPGGRKTYGHSLVISPWGEVLADGGTEPGPVICEVDLAEVKAMREKIPSLKHCRNDELTAHDYSI